MKKLVVFMTFCWILPIAAQTKDSIFVPKNENGLAEYVEVVIVDSASKNEIYLSALEWVNKTYKSGKAVIQTADKEAGMIIGKANTSTLDYNNMGIHEDGGYFSYTISIYTKDNKCKIQIDNITYNKGKMVLTPGADLAEKFPSNWTGFIGNNKQTRREWKSFQRQADSELRLIIGDLKKNIRTSKKKNDW